jgi:hypothetical protein
MTQGRGAPDTGALVLTMLWLVGMPTLFVMGNTALPGFLNLDRALFLLVAHSGGHGRCGIAARSSHSGGSRRRWEFFCWWRCSRG